MLNKKLLSSKITLLGLVVLLAFLTNWKYKQLKNENQIEKQKQSLELQADQLQKKNSELTKSLEYLNSASFKESAARQQLDLKKQGEQVYTFSDAQVNPSRPIQNASPSGNAKKWLGYFFNTQ